MIKLYADLNMLDERDCVPVLQAHASGPLSKGARVHVDDEDLLEVEGVVVEADEFTAVVQIDRATICDRSADAWRDRGVSSTAPEQGIEYV